MPAGRPPEKSNEEWARLLDEWSKKPDATEMCFFCAENDTYPEKIYELRDRSPEFSQTLKKARQRVAARNHRAVEAGTKNYGVFMRTIGMYDQSLHDYEESVKDRDAVRGKLSQNQQAPEVLEAYAKLMEQFQKLKDKD